MKDLDAHVERLREHLGSEHVNGRAFGEHAAMIAETKESLRERDAEVAGLRNRVATLEADGKDQATQFAALEESLSSYQNYAQGLKTRLAQATSEKVQAMMEAAKGFARQLDEVKVLADNAIETSNNMQNFCNERMDIR